MIHPQPTPRRAGIPGHLDQLRGDVRFALVGLRRRPAFALLAIITLALGIGADTALFSVVNGVLLRPLPYATPERLVRIWPTTFVANRTVDNLRANARSMDAIASFSPGWLVGLTGVEVPEQLEGARVSGNLFATLGVPAQLGRTIDMEAERPGMDAVVVLSDDVWRRNFGADPGIIGRTIQLDGAGQTVIGVMPPGFQILDTTTDLWMPLAMDPAAFSWTATVTEAIGRLAPGATVPGATAEVRVLAANMREAFRQPADWGRDATVVPLRDDVVGGVRPTLLILLGAVALILLIAAANVANLLLVRASDRHAEIGVRLALGATRPRIARQLLTESMVLAGAGGAAGLTLAWFGVRVLRAVLPPDTPRLAEITVDGTVLGACLLVSLITGLAFGAAPAAIAARGGLAGWLRKGAEARGGGRLRGILISAEVALALVLATGATLMVRTLVSIRSVDPGFRVDHLLTMRVQPRPGASPERLRVFWRDALDRIDAIPGVRSTATVLHLPMSGRSWTTNIAVEGRPLAPGATPPHAAWQAVSTGYFETMDVPLVRGRALLPTDDAGAPLVAVVNDVFAASFFPGEDAIGRRFSGTYSTGDDLVTIVGVVESIHHDSLTASPAAEFYVPFEQRSVVANSLIVRVDGDPARLSSTITSALWAADPDVPVSHIMTMDDLLSASIVRPRVLLYLLAAFAAVGLLLGAVGIYGVVAWTARLRAKEIGIRIALGARRASVIGLVVRQTLGWTLAGIAIGTVAALVLARLMRGFLFGIPATDPLTFALVPLVLLAVAGAAGYLPARRASDTDPATTLTER